MEPIANGLDNTGSYLWDTSGLAEGGTWYLYATASDGVNDPVGAYSEGQIHRITPNHAPSIEITSPSEITTVPIDGIAVIEWIGGDDDPEDTLLVDLYYINITDPANPLEILGAQGLPNEISSFSWEIAGVSVSDSLRIAAVITDGELLCSDISDGILIFDASPVDDAFYAVAQTAEEVLVRWSLSSVGGISGINVWRSTHPDAEFTLLNATPLPPDLAGTFTDRTVWPETTFWYDLRAVLASGSESALTSALSCATTGGSLGFVLYDAKPNPLTSSTELEFDLRDSSHPVSLGIYNVRGQLVDELLSAYLGRGRHVAFWDGCDARGRPVGSGVYFARLSSGEGSQCRKLMLLR